jgi:biotin transporter BioY
MAIRTSRIPARFPYYLVAFIAGAFITGVLCERGWDRSALRLFGVMVLGHAVILAGGFVWLAFGMKFGVTKAWLIGVGLSSPAPSSKARSARH